MKTLLVTGGCGFIGHSVIEYFLNNTDYKIIIIDRLDKTSTLHRLTDALKHVLNWQDRVKFIYHNLRSAIPQYILNKIESTNYVLHLAASTHVDRSIENPLEFIEDNILGTHNLLWACKYLDSLDKIIYFSTDEVFGPRMESGAKEWDHYNSGNPYAATKAGAEELALAYANTYRLPILITHTMNAYGERQHPEKFIPLVIKKVMNGEEILIHADKTCTKPGSRYWIHAKDIAHALKFLLVKGETHDKYNIVGEREVNNLEIVQKIGEILGRKPLYKLVDFHSSRPGHDLRYALDGEKLKSLGHTHQYNFEQGIAQTVNWFVNNPEWLN